MTQEQTAKLFGFKDRQTLAAIEAGQRKLTAEELVRAVDIFQLDLDYFTDPLRLVGEGSFNWRASTGMTAASLDSLEQRAGRWVAVYRRLRNLGSKQTLLNKTLSLNVRNSFEEAMDAAESLGIEWQLGECPAQELEAALRRELDALILYVQWPKGVSGAACQLPGLNAILINRSEPEGRRHYDLAHECFHLLTWEQMPPEHAELIETVHRGKGTRKRIELLADNFAAALLMPTRALRPLWAAHHNRDINQWLNETASAFRVTAQALRWRLINLGWLSKKDQLQIQDAKLTANGRPHAQQPTPRPFNEEFVKLLRSAIERGDLSVRRVAALLEVTIEDLADLFRQYDLAVPFDL